MSGASPPAENAQLALLLCQLQTQINKMRAENTELREQVQAANQKIESLEESSSKMNDDVTWVGNELTIFQQKAKYSIQELREQAIQTNAQLVGEQSVTKLSLENQQRELQALQTKTNEQDAWLRAQVTEQNNAIRALQEQLEETSRRLTAAENANARLQEENDENRRTIDSLRGDLRETQSQCRMLAHTVQEQARCTLFVENGTQEICQGKYPCDSAERVIVPACVTTIGKNAFSGWKNLKQIVFAEDSELRTIGQGAFEGTGLETFVAPKSLRTIGEAAFRHCQSLATVELNEGLQALGAQCFQDCQFSGIILPSTVTSLGEAAFGQCRDLYAIKCSKQEPRLFRSDAIILPSLQTQVRDKLLWDLRRFSELYLPHGLREIGDNWFAGSQIQKVHIPKSVQNIGKKAFYHCPMLRSVVIADCSELKNVESAAFDQSGNLAIVYVSRNLKCDMKECHGCNFVVVKLPDPNISIGEQTLGRLRKQRVLKLPNDLQTIERGWFANTDVEVVIVPAGVREIQPYAFAGCEKLHKVQFADNAMLTDIWGGAFAMSGLERFDAPASLRHVSQAAFYGCKELRAVRLNEKLAELGSEQTGALTAGEEMRFGVFQDSGVVQVEFPRTLSTIHCAAFYGCTSLRKVALPEGLEYIRECAFVRSGLLEVETPYSLRGVGNCAFQKCHNLRKVVLNDGLKTLGWCAFQKCGLHSVRLPKTLESLGKYAFSYCEYLRHVEFPQGLQVIEDGCFRGSGLEAVFFPSSVWELRPFAFCDCSRLRTARAVNEAVLRAAERNVFEGTQVEVKEYPAPLGGNVRPK